MCFQTFVLPNATFDCVARVCSTLLDFLVFTHTNLLLLNESLVITKPNVSSVLVVSITENIASPPVS